MAAVNNGTSILKCSCKDSQQDKLYGYQMRLHNNGGNKAQAKAYCTVCGNKKDIKMKS